jgi:SAM-dependent methyltransferase
VLWKLCGKLSILASLGSLDRRRFAFAILGGRLMAQQPRQAFSDAGYWNEVFARPKNRRLFNSQSNTWMAAFVSKLKPARALDIGMGDGRNSIFLAKAGWRVTGIDISSEGVGLAMRRAEDSKVRIDARILDVKDFSFEKDRWDLILLFYVEPLLETHAARIQDGLAKDGFVLIEYAAATSTGAGRDVLRKFEEMLPSLDIRFFQDLPGSSDWSSNLSDQRIVRIIAQKR